MKELPDAVKRARKGMSAEDEAAYFESKLPLRRRGSTVVDGSLPTEIEQLRKEIRALEEKRVELNATIGERDAEIERQRKGLSPPHRCEKIASAIMDDGRDWWVGRLLEPVAEHPQETHCLHLRTPIKDVVFLVNDADFQWLTVLGRAACGAINETWLERVADGAKKRAETTKDTTDG